MSFDLVAYDLLRASIRESIRTLIEYHNPDRKIDMSRLNESVVLLQGDRRAQAELLLSVIDLTDKIDVAKRALILNAAAYYVLDKIAASYRYINPERSKLHQLLTTSLALNPESNNPSTSEVRRMYHALREFLVAQIYRDADPVKGYLEPSSLICIKNYIIEADIVDLVNKVSQMDCSLIAKAKSLHERALTNPGSVRSDPSSYRFTPVPGDGLRRTDAEQRPPSSLARSFQLVEYPLLKVKLKESIKALIKCDHPDSLIDLDRLMESIPLLDGERRAQAELFLRVIEAFEQVDDSAEALMSHTLLLNALAYFIRDKIKGSYSNSYFSGPENSRLYGFLTYSLALTQDNVPSTHDLSRMYHALKEFFYAQTYRDADPVKGYLEPSPIAGIVNYVVEDDIVALIKKASEMDCMLINQAQRQRSLASTTAQRRGFLSSFSFLAAANGAETGVDLPTATTASPTGQ